MNGRRWPAHIGSNWGNLLFLLGDHEPRFVLNDKIDFVLEVRGPHVLGAGRKLVHARTEARHPEVLQVAGFIATDLLK
jgi:hypothetical protein